VSVVVGVVSVVICVFVCDLGVVSVVVLGIVDVCRCCVVL
jgi:hypothetical protein